MRPHDQGDLIISVKGEEQLTRAGSSTMTLCGIGAIGCGILGVVLIMMGLLQR